MPEFLRDWTELIHGRAYVAEAVARAVWQRSCLALADASRRFAGARANADGILNSVEEYREPQLRSIATPDRNTTHQKRGQDQ